MVCTWQRRFHIGNITLDSKVKVKLYLLSFFRHEATNLLHILKVCTRTRERMFQVAKMTLEKCRKMTFNSYNFNFFHYSFS